MPTILPATIWCARVSILSPSSRPSLRMLIICSAMLHSAVPCISVIRRKNSLLPRISSICSKKIIRNWMPVRSTCYWFCRQNMAVVTTRLSRFVWLLPPEQIHIRPSPQVSVRWKARFTEARISRLLICSIICRRTSRTGRAWTR